MSTFITLIYHSLAKASHSTYTVSSELFKTQLAWLRSEGCVIEGFDGLEQRLVTNQWPERYIVMTFDDGHNSNLQAAEILHKNGARATFFLTKQLCQTRDDYLSEQDIRALADLFQVGSHSVTHPYMAKLPPAQIRYELADSKAWLEDVTNKAVTAFSAPNGSINAKVIKLAMDAGYTLLGNSFEWWNHPSQVAAARIVNRIAVRRSFSMTAFATIVQQNTLFFLKRRIRSGLLLLPKALLTPEQIKRLTKSMSRLDKTYH